jgi:hypothetical protein
VTPEEINGWWTRRFPECPPVGYLFKHLYRERCARFRLLDDGRTPSSEPDFSESGRRQAALLDELFAGEARIMLITTIPSELETPPQDAPSFLNFDPHGQFLQSLGMHEFELEFDTPSFWHLFVSSRDNKPESFRAVLRASAGDASASGVVNTLLLGPESGRVIYIYPGGADAVVENAARRDELRATFAAWSV